MAGSQWKQEMDLQFQGLHFSVHETYYDTALVRNWTSYLKGDRLIDVRQAELLQEAFVLAPEQSDIRDAEQNHGEPLQP